VKYWEIIADNRSKAGWSWGCASAIDCNGRTLFVADAHCDDGKRFVVRADEKLTAFIELEAAIRACGESHKRALHTLNLHTASKTYVEEICPGWTPPGASSVCSAEWSTLFRLGCNLELTQKQKTPVSSPTEAFAFVF
jgi:hypothetical protein